MNHPRESKFEEPALEKGGFSVRTLTGTGEALRPAIVALQAGDAVAIPTETVYGLAANALDAEACAGIFHIKGRPLIDPLIAHVRNAAHAAELVEWSAAAERVAQAFWPGALTLVLRKKACVPEIVTAGLPTAAIRCPNHPVAQEILRLSGLALAAPSANPFGYVSPTRAEHVVESLGNRLRYVVDGGPCRIGIESTILDLTDEEHPKILRPGAITAEMLAEVLGTPVELKEQSMPEQSLKAAPAPGMLERHYSPKARLYLHTEALPEATDNKTARIFLKRPQEARPEGDFWLSEDGSLESVARGIFHLLRSLDNAGVETIHMEMPPFEGIGIALNDRLKRAACKRS